MANTEFIYGIHSSRHALKYSTDTVTRIWFLADSKSSALLQLQEIANKHSLSVEKVPRLHLDRLSNYASHQGVVLERRLRETADDNLTGLLLQLTKGPNLVLVLDRIQDPHNLGACLRTANAADVAGVIVPKNQSATVNATVKKTASGAVETTTVVTVVNIKRALEKLKNAGFWIVGAVCDTTADSLYEMDFASSTALVMGGECKGLRKSVRDSCDHLISIPILGKVESLNVSVACGVILYEMQRKLRF